LVGLGSCGQETTEGEIAVRSAAVSFPVTLRPWSRRPAMSLAPQSFGCWVAGALFEAAERIASRQHK
jgi:hypothetical protein